MKLRFLRGEKKVPYVPDLQKVLSDLPDPEGAAFFLNLAARSVTVVKPSPPGRVFPLKPENAGRVLLAGQFNGFFRAGKAAFPGADSFWCGESGGAALASYARNADTVIFCLSGAADLPALRGLESLNKRVIVLSVLSPAYLESVPWVTGAVAVYSYAPESFAAGFSAIIGRIPARGRLPYD
jgi:beta-N-acetylhexosaminidase